METSIGPAGQALSTRLQALYYSAWLAIQRRPGNIIRDDQGRATAAVMERCGIPVNDANKASMSSVLRALDEDGIITRDYNPSQKRTYWVKIEKPLIERQIHRITAGRKNLQEMFATSEKEVETDATDTSVASVPAFDQLLADCRRAHATLLSVTAEARAESKDGRVNVSVTAEFLKIDIDRLYGEQIRYYLRLLGLAKTAGRVGNGSRRSWWRISECTVDATVLRELVNGENSFENHQARKGLEVVPRPATSTSTPASQAKSHRSKETAAVASTTVPPQTKVGMPTTGEQLESGSVAELLQLLEGLVEENAQLRAQLVPQSPLAEKAQAFLTRHKAKKK